jgi:hypothetical protein
MELKAIYKYLDEILRIGKILPSKSLAKAPILFISKAHRKDLLLYINYYELTKMTILNEYPLLLLNEFRDLVQGSKLFTKIDLKARYNLIRIYIDYEWISVYQTTYRYYEYLVTCVRW